MAKTVKVEDLSTEKTIYYLKKEGEIKKKVKDYLDWLEKEYPSTSGGIQKIWNDEKTKKDWKEYSDKTGNWLEFIRYFTFHSTIIEGIKKDAEEKLTQLFTINDSNDSDIKKNLKSQPLKGLIDDFKMDYKADQIAWAVELCKDFYLERLPKYIEKSLKTKEPFITLNDLSEEKWKKFRQKIFDHLYGSWTKTIEESEIKNLEEQLDKDIVELNELVEETQKTFVDDLRATKEKYKKENSKGEPWDLTDLEKARIDKAPNKQELEKVVEAIEKDYAKRKELEKVNEWIKENISDKTKIEELPSDSDIEGASEIPAQFKEEVKLKRWEREIELTPKSTIVEGKIKQHLTEVLYKWKKWEFLTDNSKNSDKSYITALMFNEKFREKVAKDMKEKIETAIKTNTLEGYRGLDKEWGEKKVNEKGEVEYNVEREFLGAWSILRDLLRKESSSKYDKIKKYVTTNYYGEKWWEDMENEAQIEVMDNQI